MTNREKNFRKELGQLLEKYKAEISMEDCYDGYSTPYLEVEFYRIDGDETPMFVDIGRYLDKSIGEIQNVS